MPLSNDYQLNHKPQAPCYRYLEDGGEMGQLIRSFNWADSPVGSPDKWPEGLLVALSIMLHSRFPMFLWWGPHHIQFYNDAFRPIMGNDGKHPKALGQKGAECWPEIWSDIQPSIDQIMAGGEAIIKEDQLVNIYRNNALEDVYWTFSYSRLNGEDGKPGGVLGICSETTDKVRIHNILQEAKRELEFAIEAAELATWDINPVTGRFIGNDRMKTWFGLPLDQEINFNAAVDAIVDEDKERVTTAIENALQKGSDGNYNIIYTIANKKDNIRRVVKAVGKAVFDADSNPYRFSGIKEDVTDEYQLQQRKDEFISIASHELKTPLTSLKASIQLLQRIVQNDHQPDKLPVFLNTANNNVNKLVSLMEDLMNVSKIQQGQLGLNKTSFDIAELVRECYEHVGLNGTHEMRLTSDEALIVNADYRRVDQVLINLINNAVKYAPQSNRIEVNIEPDGHMAKVSVRDYGIGISEDKLPHLFGRYYRVDASGVQFSGLGLGLYISSEIIKRHGGNIGVLSEVGKGSTFWFTLPIEE